MSEKLKSCPFCGNDESVMVEKYGTPAGDRYRAVCPVCMATVDNGFSKTAKQDIGAWNRRDDEWASLNRARFAAVR